MKKILSLLLLLALVFVFSACGEATYDFEKMADNLHKQNGEEYNIRLEGNTVYITRTCTLPASGRNREKIANLSQEEFDEWANGWWFIIGNEQSDYEEIFHENGNDYDVLITYLLRDAEKNEIGSIDINGCAFTLDDLQPYKTSGPNITKTPKEYKNEIINETVDNFNNSADVEIAIMNTYAILNNYIVGRNVRFDTESLLIMAEHIDEVIASELITQKPISILNDGYVVEIEYANAIIYWGLGAESDEVKVIEK